MNSLFNNLLIATEKHVTNEPKDSQQKAVKEHVLNTQRSYSCCREIILFDNK